MSQVGNVFVIDDDEAVLRSVNAVLTQFGYEPQCFGSANQFLQQTPLDEPGCVVTDLQMPGIDGMQLQERLAAAHSMLSIIFLTGVADVPTAVKVMRQGAATLLEKPFNISDLLNSVQHGINSSSERWKARRLEQIVRANLAALTEDEQAVMKMMLNGAPNKAIASTLDIGMRTVDRRRQAIFRKMDVVATAELAMLVSTICPEFLE